MSGAKTKMDSLDWILKKASLFQIQNFAVLTLKFKISLVVIFIQAWYQKMASSIWWEEGMEADSDWEKIMKKQEYQL